MNCPICKKKNISAGHIMGHSRSDSKADAARENGKLGGRPRLNRETGIRAKRLTR